MRLAAQEPAPPSPGSAPIVLVVDDLPQNATALAAVLDGLPMQVLCVHSGRAALEALLAHDVSVALIDVNMPLMDGFELAEAMRGVQRTRHVPIIFVTAAMRDPLRSFRGYERGAVDFLQKRRSAGDPQQGRGVHAAGAHPRRVAAAGGRTRSQPAPP